MFVMDRHGRLASEEEHRAVNPPRRRHSIVSFTASPCPSRLEKVGPKPFLWACGT